MKKGITACVFGLGVFGGGLYAATQTAAGWPALIMLGGIGLVFTGVIFVGLVIAPSRW